MYRVVCILMVALLWAVSANAAPLVGFSPDGSGVASYDDVIGFDWLPGNSLAIGGSAASAEFVNTSTIVDLSGGFFVIFGGDKTPIQVLYQAELEAIQRDGGATAPPVDQVTLVFGFQENISSVLVNTNNGQSTVHLNYLAGGTNFFEMYADPGGTVADALNGTGYNDGTLIMSGVITGDSFTSNFTSSLSGDVGNPLDQAGLNNYDGAGGNPGPSAPANQGPIDTVEGSGGIRLIALIDTAVTDTNYFFDPTGVSDSSLISELDFGQTLSLPFLNSDPSARFVMGAGGGAPVIAGAGIVPNALGPSGSSTVGLGLVNGGFVSGSPLTQDVVSGGPDMQFGGDATNSFFVLRVAEPSTLLLALLALAVVGGWRKWKRAA